MILPVQYDTLPVPKHCRKNVKYLYKHIYMSLDVQNKKNCARGLDIKRNIICLKLGIFTDRHRDRTFFKKEEAIFFGRLWDFGISFE